LDQYEGDSSTLIGFGTSARSGELPNMLQRTVITIYDYRYNHGRPQTFFQGRGKFSRGRAKSYYLFA